jgi:hypothetical protein
MSTTDTTNVFDHCTIINITVVSEALAGLPVDEPEATTEVEPGEDPYVEIPLTQGYVAWVSPEDAERVKAAGPWFAIVKSDRLVYARHGSVRPDGGRTTECLHQFIMGPAPEGMVVDHIEHGAFGGLDCRRSNMRFVTPAESVRHRRIAKSNTSGIIGVSWHKKTGKWRAQIRANGKILHLGLYDDIEGAKAAYQAASKKYHGEFGAVMNYRIPQ